MDKKLLQVADKPTEKWPAKSDGTMLNNSTHDSANVD